MSSDSGTELSFDPRTWLSGLDDDEEPEPQARARRAAENPIMHESGIRPLLAAMAAAGILIAGGAAAYATREAPQPLSAADPQEP